MYIYKKAKWHATHHNPCPQLLICAAAAATAAPIPLARAGFADDSVSVAAWSMRAAASFGSTECRQLDSHVAYDLWHE